LIERGVRRLVVMTECQSFCYNYEGQFRDVFANVPFGALLDEHNLPRTRHTITEPDDQVFVTQPISDWAIAGRGPRRPRMTRYDKWQRIGLRRCRRIPS
jgi:hypothetical protein